MTRPRLLDLYCCQGGAAKGYADAGFEVIGVDIDSQPLYPFKFLWGDALAVLASLINGAALEWDNGLGLTRGVRITTRALGVGPRYTLSDIDAIHTSPPCQAHTKAWKLNKREHPKLIAPTRDLLIEAGLPYIIENVEEALDELIDPVMLCGESFDLETYRHRLFETNWNLQAPSHPKHLVRTTKMGRAPVDGEYMHIVGNFSGVDRARNIMGMPWATRDGLREAIPPAYTEFIGYQLMTVLEHAA